MILEGKTVVVCGVGPGLGGEVARLALRDGANVMIAARREDSLKSIAEERNGKLPRFPAFSRVVLCSHLCYHSAQQAGYHSYCPAAPAHGARNSAPQQRPTR